MSAWIYVTALGEDSHRFVAPGDPKALVLGGVRFEGLPGLAGNSDADVLMHALCHAISGLTGKPVLGPRADLLCQAGKTESIHYLKLALEDLALDPRGYELLHLSMSLEGQRPKILPMRAPICQALARSLSLPPEAVCLTATTGEDLTAFGRGEGLRASCLLSARRRGN